tara:strand:- start:144 stop:479 length:336 start_codon:yes stop_codon:yes gene_type:complete
MASDESKLVMTQLQDLELSEEIVFMPNGGIPRTITALVDREGSDEYASAASVRIRVKVLADVVLGVQNADVIDRGRDRIQVADRRGGALVTRGIHSFPAQDDPDFLVIEVR